MENLINSVCHTRKLGYRNFDTPDQSVNNPVLGLLAFGQGWHNNHHAAPKRANYGSRWYELDPAVPLIWLVRRGR